MSTEIAAVEFHKMSRLQKLAALLIVLGPDTASQMMKNFTEQELESVSLEMSRISSISPEMQREVLHEFTNVAVEASTAIAGATYVRSALEKSVGAFRATEIIGRLGPNSAPVASMQQILSLDSRQLFTLLKNEQPQTVALIVSYLAPEKSSVLLMSFRGEMRDQIVERLAMLGATPIEVVERVADILNQRIGVKTTRGLNQSGGIKNAADLLNSIDRNVSQSLLMELEKRNSELAQSIRGKMFTFEDLSRLDNNALQKVMREVDMRDLAISLKTATPKLKTSLLASISKRAAETVNEEISFLGPQKKKDIEAAQTRIIDGVRRLEANGELDLAEITGQSRDEVLV